MADLKRTNDALDLSKDWAAVIGGTQGIGAATALRFAQLGASVVVVGRNENLGNQVVEDMKKATCNKEAKFEFVKSDLSLVSGIKSTAGNLLSLTDSSGGLSFLVQCQGGPPNGRWLETSQGINFNFATQCLSRFAIPYLLLKDGKKGIKDGGSIVNVAAPGGSTTEFDPSDLELRKLKEDGKIGIFSMAKRDSVVLDSVTQEFNTKFPTVSAYHIFPGFVRTKGLANQSFPFPVPQIASVVTWLPATLGLLNTPTSYAEIPTYWAANPEGRALGIRFSSAPTKKVEPNAWTKDPENRKKIWEKLASYVD